MQQKMKSNQSLRTAINEAPRSKLRSITELNHSELPEIFPRLPLPLHLPFDGLPVGPRPYRPHSTHRSKTPRPTVPVSPRAFGERSPAP